MAKYARKNNGVSFQALENRVAPMVIKLAETLERSMGGGGGGGEDRQQMIKKIAKQIKNQATDKKK